MRRRAIAAIAVLGALAFAGSAQACSCVPRGPAKALREADAAIVARLVKVVPRSRVRADFRYRVRRVYRGAKRIARGQVVSVRSARSAAACALPHRVGRRYGLFLAWEDGRWHGGICGVIAPRRLRVAARGRVAGRGPRMSTASCGG